MSIWNPAGDGGLVSVHWRTIPSEGKGRDGHERPRRSTGLGRAAQAASAQVSPVSPGLFLYILFGL